MGTSVCPLLVGLSSGEFFGERSRVVISPKRDHSEQNQPVSTILDADLAVLPQMTTVVEALHPSMVEVRDQVSWPLGPCSKSAGGGNSDWQGNLVVDSSISRTIGLGLPINHL